MNKINIDDVDILTELGHGVYGTVYLVEYKNKKYALKIEKVLESDIPDKNSKIFKQIEFSQKISNKYPNQFINLYAHDINYNCNLVQQLVSGQQLSSDYIKKRNKSTICTRYLFSLIDGSVDTIIDSLNCKQIYSLLCQTMFAIHLLEKHGYVHGDIHMGNIGYIKTKKVYINILGFRIPTFGYLYKLIDYGSIMNKNDKNDKKQMQQFNYYFKREMFLLASEILIDYGDFWRHVAKYNIKINRFKDFKVFMKSKENKILKEYIKDNDIRFSVYTVLFPEKFQKQMFNIKTIIRPTIHCDQFDYLYIAMNGNNIKKIIKYVLTKIEK
jgi:serine/threonine protein kinase